MQQSNTNFTPPRLLLIHPSVLPFGILFLKNAYKKFACKNVVSLVIHAVFLRYCCYDFLFCDDDENDDDDDVFVESLTNKNVLELFPAGSLPQVLTTVYPNTLRI